MAGVLLGAAPLPGQPAPRSATGRLSALPYRLAYRLAWVTRDLLRPLTTPQMRSRVRALLVRRAFPAQAAPALPGVTDASAAPFGVTVVGYLHAESGVGESARATLRVASSRPSRH